MAPSIASPDLLTRSALLALELVDPVSLELVSKGITLRAEGLERAPLQNLTGRFVWLREGERWPSSFTFEPGSLPFARQQVLAPARPADLARDVGMRVVRVVLRPTPMYPFETGVTSLRGRLLASANGAPMAGVRMQLAFRDEQSAEWLPRPPQPIVNASPPELETDRNGEFALFLRSAPQPGVTPDLNQGQLRVRVQATHAAPFETRATPDDFVFAPTAAAGRLALGLPLARDLTLTWNTLRPL